MAQQQPLTTDNNLTALYAFLEEEHNGIMWSKSVIDAAQALCKPVEVFNKIKALERAKQKAKDQDVGMTESEEASLTEKIDSLKTQLGDFKPGATYQAPDLTGNWQSLQFPDAEKLGINFASNLDLSKLFDENNTLVANHGKTPLWSVIPFNLTDHDRRPGCGKEHWPWTMWKESWNEGKWQDRIWGHFTKPNDPQSGELRWKMMSEKFGVPKVCPAPFWKGLSDKLKNLIIKHGERLQNVDKVICVALGTPSYHAVSSHSFLQHLAARTIADTLNKLREERKSFTKIPVLAQDPAYCENCKVVLKSELDIEVVTDLSGFQKLDQNTFVVVISPSGPLRAIMLDMIRDCGGPAAMLCQRIEKDCLRFERETKGKISDTETKNMVEWSSQCVEENYDDAWDYMGMPWTEFAAKYFEMPYMPYEPEKGLVPKPGIGEEHLKAYDMKGKVAFQDCCLYVRGT